ncbi:solute carrier-like [Tropilaelaps mercedesae]|uniref:Solute carrier-like n=1 Tax=Tropilaelaps mercedesae TaxID=418985 RepID=A0A1V9WZL7_9ACAR|nr:solute carrier-like [Tropilaelaps mercedesae]
MWIVTNFLLVFALRLLDTTDVLALYSTHVSFVYLLSWVILHEQFVGVRRRQRSICLHSRMRCMVRIPRKPLIPYEGFVSKESKTSSVNPSTSVPKKAFD